MDTLRWILLAFGIILVAGIYWFGRRSQSKQESTLAKRLDLRKEPDLLPDNDTLSDQNSASSVLEQASNELDKQDEQPLAEAAVEADAMQGLLGQGASITEAEASDSAAPFAQADYKQAGFDDFAAPQTTGVDKPPRDIPLDDNADDKASATPTEIGLMNFEALIQEGLSSQQKPIDSTPPASSIPESSIKAEPSIKPASTPAASSTSMLVDEEMVVLNVFARDANGLSGKTLYDELTNNGLQLGEMEVFHYKQNGKKCFSVLNAFKPGTFPLDPTGFVTKGVTFLLILPDVDDCLQSFENMLLIAHNISVSMDARLLDAQRSSLSKQTISYLQEEIKAYQLRQR